MFLLLATSGALAADWTVTAVPEMPIRAPGPSEAQGGQIWSTTLDKCEVGFDGCEASDAGWSAPSSWSAITCSTRLSDDGARVEVVATFEADTDAAGFTVWPPLAQWPEDYTCSRTINGETHTYVGTISDAPPDLRFEAPYDGTLISLEQGGAVSVDPLWDKKAKGFNVPDGSYVVDFPAKGPDGEHFDGVYCSYIDVSDDHLLVVVDRTLAVSGVASCEGTVDGQPFSTPFLDHRELIVRGRRRLPQLDPARIQGVAFARAGRSGGSRLVRGGEPDRADPRPSDHGGVCAGARGAGRCRA